MLEYPQRFERSSSVTTVKHINQTSNQKRQQQQQQKQQKQQQQQYYPACYYSCSNGILSGSTTIGSPCTSVSGGQSNQSVRFSTNSSSISHSTSCGILQTAKCVTFQGSGIGASNNNDTSSGRSSRSSSGSNSGIHNFNCDGPGQKSMASNMKHGNTN